MDRCRLLAGQEAAVAEGGGGGWRPLVVAILLELEGAVYHSVDLVKAKNTRWGGARGPRVTAKAQDKEVQEIQV